MARILLLIIMLIGCYPATTHAQSGTLADLYNRMWFIIAKKCTGDQQLLQPADQFESYYFTIKWTPDNPGDMNQGRYEIMYRDIIEGERETGHYIVRREKTGEGRLILDAGYGNKREYMILLSDKNHMTMTLVAGAPSENCKAFYAVAQSAPKQ